MLAEGAITFNSGRTPRLRWVKTLKAEPGKVDPVSAAVGATLVAALGAQAFRPAFFA
jgi:hypothetical protein